MMGISSPGLSWKEAMSDEVRDASGLVHQLLSGGVGEGIGGGVGVGIGVGDGICARTSAGLSISTAQSNSNLENQGNLDRAMVFIFSLQRFLRFGLVNVGGGWKL